MTTPYWYSPDSEYNINANPMGLIDLQPKREPEFLPHPSCIPRNDNPYLPHHLQGIYLKVDDLAVPEILLDFPSHTTNKTYGGCESFSSVAPPMHGLGDISIATSIPVHDDMMPNEHIADTDDNSSDSLEPLKDHEFPGYFTEYGSPLRLFHSHGTYGLPVDGTEMKVCTTSPHWLKLTNNTSL